MVVSGIFHPFSVGTFKVVVTELSGTEAVPFGGIARRTT